MPYLLPVVYTVSLESFRCYDFDRTTIDQPVLWITGPNGAGKTSWLEALSLFSPGKGLRGAASGDLQNHGVHTPWRIQLSVDTQTGPVCLETRGSDGARKMLAHGGGLKNQMAMRQWVNMIWPMVISTDTISTRRAYLNRLTFSLDVSYGPLWLRYEKALRQRNILLQQGVTNATWYDAIEDILSETAALLFEKRTAALARIHTAIRGNVTPFPQPQCAMSGEAETSLINDPSGSHYRQVLGQNRGQHRLQKTTSFGLHKTRFLLTHPNGREWGVCSMGEQKGLLLSLALALFRVCLKDQPHVIHFLLLDEGMTHLDEHRTAWLWGELLFLAGGREGQSDVGAHSGTVGAGGMVVVTGTGGDAPAGVAHWKIPPSVSAV